MIRLRLIRIPAALLISTTLFAAGAIAWAISPWRSTGVAFYSPAGHLQLLGSDRRGLLLFLSDVPFGSDFAWTAEGVTVPANQASPLVHDEIFDAARAGWSFLGFHFVRGSISSLHAQFQAALIPFWFILPPLAILPAGAVRRVWIRWRRRRLGLCRQCGYDLRHSPGRRPECGASRTPETPPSDPLTQSRPVRGRLLATLSLMPGFALMLLLGGVGSLLIRHAVVEGHVIDPESVGGRIAEIDLQEQPFTAAVTAVASQAHTPVRLQPGIASPARHPDLNRISLRLHDVSLVTAMGAILHPAFGTSQTDLQTWVDDRGVLTFGDSSAAPGLLRTYWVEDLLKPRYPAADITSSLVAGSQTRGNMLFSGGSGVSFYTPAETEDGLARLAESADDDWISAGPAPFEAVVLGNRLVMQTTQRGHVAIAHLLSALRCATPEGTPVDAPNDNKGSSDLEQSIAEVELGPTFHAAITKLADLTHANLLVDWEALKLVDVSRTTPVRLHLWDLSLKRALNTLFAALGNDGHLVQIVAAPRSEVIWVSTGDALYASSPLPTSAHSATPVRIYDVLDVIEMFYHRSEKFLATAKSSTQPSDAAHPTLEEAVEQLAKLIEDTVSTDSWKDNGGSTGAMREFSGWLIITQTPENHAKLVKLLRFLRTGGDSKEGFDLDSLK